MPKTPAKHSASANSTPAVQWPADRVERRKVADLVPYARNARTHSDEQVAQIAASIREWGWTVPVLVDEKSTIIAGHGRVLAAQKLGLTDIPVMVAKGWTDAQRRAYVLADNKLALNAGWDTDLLKVEVEELLAAGFDVGLAGFSGDEINGLTFGGSDGLTDPDDTPDPQPDPVSVLGDVWVLGSHRLVCGDCTDADAVSRCLDGSSPKLMVTDPPYGVEYDPAFRERIERANGTKVSIRAKGKVLNDDRADWSDAYALFPGDVAYVWHSALKTHEFVSSLAMQDFNARSVIIWDKGRFAIGRGDYHWQHEPCLYVVKKGRKGHWNGDRSQSTVWYIPNPKNDTGHGTQKPVECMKRPIENNSSIGDAVYEPFSGSGTTIIAAEMTGRQCRAIELNPVYVDVAVRRWQQFTGRQATHADNGKTFDEIVQQRMKANGKA